ncbi:DsbE family thiol:disulfide interchange protein [Methylolobus aquaticus]|nr:DsbE family thiol:disulfide interchange protein [Methylolobus aquaticus]
MTFLIPLVVFVLMVVLLGVGLTLNPREVPSPFIGKPAPAFSVPQLHAPAEALSSEVFRGQVSLLNVWASWCVSCRQEHPLLVELAKTSRVPIYGLNYKDERNAALEWLARLGNPYRSSAFDADGRVGIDWGVYGVPETFVIDRKGIIRHKFTGPLTREAIDGILLPLVQQLEGEPG